ncbi:hypothetical protein [Shimazuella alba]|nr:hypothetical protein [Shimazuella alba]
MKQLNVAVIGLGVMGQTHARIYAEITSIKQKRRYITIFCGC